jgi:peptidoglycan/xylan/chitin deacetylase (PgdA/CDA1 family)
MITDARALVRRLQRIVPPARDGATVLCYHLVSAGTAGPVDIPAAAFRRQMEELHEAAAVVHLDTALARVGRGEVGRRPLVVLTFDDGYGNFYTNAWPVLRELALPATLYVPVGFVEGRCPPPIAHTAGLRPLTWAQLAEMASTDLVRIGSHSDTHCDLRVSGVDLPREIVGSREALERRLGGPVDSFCYPRGLWTPAAEREVARTYGSAVGGGGRRVTSDRRRRHRLGRVPIRRDMPTSLTTVLRGRVWLEEWTAALVRGLR